MFFVNKYKTLLEEWRCENRYATELARGRYRIKLYEMEGTDK